MTWLREEEQPLDFRFGHKGKGYYLEAGAVMQCLSDGKTESDRLPLDFSLELMQVMDAIRKIAGIRYPHD